ncbi:DMT family transporter [Ammoniphilus sp. CFH 90114]|uniref:DMT family transporter n=1 Tax=Ammoniphilus sp. CFH 90114 TaxID=2493665 RepID=UPI00100F8742|nr:DMT family transporter [Ammoniphilus sp. CFH 90114]RXT15419.1 DMT family transporter [Ammoniphilus sp. CFH 90114]
MNPITNKVWNSPYLLLLFASLFWGGNAVAARFFSEIVPPFTLSLIRLGISSLILLLFSYRCLVREWGVVKNHFKLILLLAITGVIGFNLIAYWAAHYTKAFNISLLNSTTPFFMVILSYFLMKEKLKINVMMAIIVSFSGILWVMTEGSIARLVSLQFNFGDLVMLVAVLFWSVYSIYVKKTAGVLSPLSLFGYSSLLGTLLLIPTSYIELLFLPLGPLGVKEFAGLLYLGIFPSIGAFLFWNRALLLIGPSRASLFQNLIPIWGAVLAYIILGEQITSAHLIGGLLVFTGILISRKKEESKEVHLVSEPAGKAQG